VRTGKAQGSPHEVTRYTLNRAAQTALRVARTLLLLATGVLTDEEIHHWAAKGPQRNPPAPA
jgi:hypothetical protein